jgi:hypothetical protein
LHGNRVAHGILKKANELPIPRFRPVRFLSPVTAIPTVVIRRATMLIGKYHAGFGHRVGA